MRIKFLTDYRGVLTGEEFYRAGTVADLHADIARALVDAGRASSLPAPARRPAQDKPAPAKRKTRARSK